MIFLGLLYLAFVSLGLPDSLLGSSWPIMNVDFGVGIESAGYASMIISTGTIIASLLSHRLIRRVGTGNVTVISVAMTAIALLGFSFSPTFWWLLACAVPLGLGAGAVDSGLNEFVAEHYAAKHMNWLHCFWGIGAMLGPVLISSLVQMSYTWRTGYLSISLIQFALVVLLLFSLPMWKKFETKYPQTKTNPIGKKQGLFSLLQEKGAIYAMLIFFLYTSIEATMMLWGSSYLVKIKGIAPNSAAGWVSLFFFGITAGRMLSGFMTMRLSNEKLIKMGNLLIISGFFLMLLPLPSFYTLIALIVIGLGLAPVFPSMLHQTPAHFGKDNAQSAMGIQMAFAYTGTTLMPPFLGRVFSVNSFFMMPFVLLGFSIAMIFCTMRLKYMQKNECQGHCNRT